jgi:ATP-binding cassette, subfamily B, bacterial
MALLQRLGGLQPMMLLGLLQIAGTALLTIGGSLALLWRFQPLLPVALLACAVVLVRVYGRQEVRVYRSVAERSEAARMMGYCAGVITDAGAAKEVLVYGLAPWFFRRWQRLARETLREEDRLRRSGLATTLGTVGAGALVLAATYAYVAAQLGGRRLTIGDFGLYLSVVVALQQSLFLLAGNIGVTYGRLLWMRRVFTFLDDTHPSIALAPAGRGVPAPVRHRQGLELRHLGFRYPNGAEPVLRDVTCTLHAGETVAVVGENGAGKTTLVKLLTRLYDPTAGQIVLDGVPLADYDLTDLRRRISVLFQDFFHFSLSARDNIGVGDVDRAEDRERVLAAARWSGADAVVAKLPRGLDTPLDRTFTGGVDLSGGEWQKVATARAAMRDAALVVLDEPTAALDAQAEYDLFRRFRELAQGRTVLLISHRFSTVRMADRILVLEGGRIVEDGSHAELVTLGGRYAALYELQAGRYR